MIVSMYELNVLLASLLSVAAVSIILLVRTIKNLKYERDSAQEKNKADSKILFLKSRYASMGETVGNIAHQWKQPLNAIGSIQNSIKASLIFQGEISKEKLLDSVDKSFKLLQHLGETIDTFYSFLSQRNNEEMSFAIADELESIRKITEYSFQNSRIKLDFILDTNPMIQGNPNEFTHALLNLILNAKDAFDGSENDSPTITVHVRDGNDICTITISDNAGGIRVEPIEMVFDLHISTKEEGSGLGLFMTKNIIEKRFGGTIGVENKNGGACFTITLPYAEYGEYFSPETATDEKLSLARINQLTHKIIELEELEKTLRKWADIFKQAHWAIAMHAGKSSTFELTNAAFHTLYGYTAQELKTLSVPDLFTPQSLPLLSKVQQEAFEKGYVAFESLHQRKDGTTFPVSVELIAVKDDEGEILYHIANIWDLTEKKAAEERLQLKKFALDHIKDAVFLIDENAHFHYVNEGTCKALGYSREEFEGMCVGDVDPDWPHERWGEHWEVLKQSGSITMELRHKRKDGTIFPVEVSANYIEYGGKHYNMAIARDITERKAAEKDLLLINKALNNTNEAVYITILGTIIQINDGACRMLGYSREEFASMTLFDIDKDVTPEDMEAIGLAITNDGSARFERKHYTKDGRVLDVEIVGNFFEHEGITYSFSSVRDITEQKKAREELLLKEFALNRINEAVYLIDEDSMFHYVNDEACKELGYTKEELLTMGVIHIDPNATHEWWNNHWAALKEEKNFTVETSHRRKDGTLFPIEVSINYFEYNGTGYNLAVVRDITERQQLEKQKDNERMRLFFERQLVGMAITSPEHGWIHTNEKLQQMLGYSHEELSALTWTEMTYPEDLAPDIEQFERLLHGEIEDYMLEKRFIRKDGSIVYTNLAVSCVRHDDRTVNYVLALLEDITERKAAQEALAAKEREFRSLAENIPDNIARWDVERRYLYINSVQERLLCVTPEDIIGKSLSEAFPNVDFSILDGAMAQVIETGEELRFVRQPFQNIHGDMEFHNINLVPERDSSGKIVGVLGIGRDMTDIYRMQDEIATKERELRALADTSPGMMGAFHMRPDGSIYMPYVSPNIIDIFGIEPHEVAKDAMVLMALTHPDDADRIHISILESAHSMSIWHEEYRILHPIKGERWMESNTMPQPHPQGGIIWYGYFHDITERKEAEQKLSDSHAFLMKLIDSLPDPIFVKDRNHRWLILNQANCDLVGLPREQLLGKSDYDFFPKEEANVFRENDEIVFSSGKINVNEEYFTSTNGTTHYIQTIKAMFTANDGHEYLVGTIRDLSERKVMEDNLREALEFNEGIIAAIPDLLFEIAPDGTYIGIWAQDQAILAAQKEVLLGQKFQEILPPNAVNISLQAMREVDEKGVSLGKTYSLDLPEGKRWFELSVSKEKMSGNYIALSRDITERKEIEALLEKERKFLIDAQRVAHTGSWYLDIQQGILTWSDETYRIFEFDKENIDDLHKAFYACVHPDDREMVEAPYVETLKTKLPYEIEHRIVMADGRIKYVIERCEHVYDNEGTPLFSIGTVQDITERKAAEEALQSNRNLLNTILESSPGIITFALDTHYRYIAFDSKHAEVMRTIFGKVIALGMNILEAITSDEDREIAKRSFDRTLGGESFVAEEEYGDERLSRHYWQIFYSPIHSETGEVIGLTCFNVDITQRREKEETIRELNTVLEEKVKERTLQLQEAFIELQEREEKFFQLFKLSPAAISITSLERNIYLEVNDSFLTYTGFERDDVVGHSSADLGIFVYPQERDELFRRIAEEGIVNDFRYSFRSKTGEIGYAAAYGSVIIYRGEKCYLGHSYDMSAYKDIESMQRERLVLEERLSTLAASVPGVNYIFERTAEGTIRFTYLAPTFEALFGFSMESAMNDFNIVMEYIHPDDRDTIRQSIFVTARDLSDWNEEFRIHHPQKGLLWIEGQSSPVLQEDGGILWYGFFYNITERKQTEKALREREETFRAIVENSPDVISRYDLQMRRTYVNPMMEFLMGKPSEELIGKTPREFSPLPDVETFEQLFNAVVRGKSEIEHEDIYTAPWGEKRWGNQRLVPEFDEDQNVISVMVIGRDMTERLEVEKRLKLLETAINSADEAIYIIDDNNRIVYISNATYKMLGYTKEEFMGKNILDIDVHLNYHDLCDIFKNVPDDTKFTFETKQQTKEGKFINVEVHTTCFMYEGIGFGVLVVNEISLK